MGGTGSIVAALGRLLEEVGVTVELGVTAEQIEVSGGRVTGVRLAGGRHLPAGVVVANADAPYVYRHMIAPSHRRKWHDRKVERLKYSMGLFVMYFGARKKFDDLAHHTILLGPRYRELLTEIFDSKTMPQDFSLYLHAPTVTDPSMAPAGCEAFYVLAPVPNLQANIDWSVEGDRLRDRIVEDFYVTPEHFRDNLLSLHGSGFSIQPILTQSAYFRFHNKSEDVGGLYFVGAGTHPGAGMPGVLTSAKVLDRLMPVVGPNPVTGPAA
jgi:phytoene desaturase